MKDNSSISLLMPVKNGMLWLQDVVKGINAQSTKPQEKIAVDSGSTDGTPAFLEANGFIVRKILPQDFGHGKTRNLLANMASGKFVVFLSQDTVPANESWLYELVNLLNDKPNIAGAYSRQIAWEDCKPFGKYFNEKTFLPGKTKILTYENLNPYRSFSIVFSNASSCVRREVLNRFPF